MSAESLGLPSSASSAAEPPSCSGAGSLIVAGVIARTDSAHSRGVYDPPAGIEAGRMFGVLGFETDEVLEENKRDLVYRRRERDRTMGLDANRGPHECE
jgi:hypothetical protein